MNFNKKINTAFFAFTDALAKLKPDLMLVFVIASAAFERIKCYNRQPDNSISKAPDHFFWRNFKHNCY